jgi:hypothetical protein
MAESNYDVLFTLLEEAVEETSYDVGTAELALQIKPQSEAIANLREIVLNTNSGEPASDTVG